MNKLEKLVEHCNEKYPHFENERGQVDIAEALTERTELINAIKGVLHYHNGVKAEYQLPESLVRQLVDALNG